MCGCEGECEESAHPHSHPIELRRDLCDLAAEGGHLEALRWLCSRGCRVTANTSEYAARHGHLPVLCWLLARALAEAEAQEREEEEGLRERGLVLCADTASAAAKNGHVQVLRWLLERGCPYDAMATHCQDLRTLRLLYEHAPAGGPGCTWDTWTCAYFLREARLDCLAFARRHGCPWDVMSAVGAAVDGQIRALSWLSAHGAPFNHYVLSGALNVRTLEWLAEHRAWKPEDGARACLEYVRRGKLAHLQWMHRNAQRFGLRCDHAACLREARDGDRPEILEWLQSVAAPPAAGAAAAGSTLAAAQAGHEHMHRHRHRHRHRRHRH